MFDQLMPVLLKAPKSDQLIPEVDIDPMFDQLIPVLLKAPRSDQLIPD